jgi:hypothetical protein
MDKFSEQFKAFVDGEGGPLSPDTLVTRIVPIKRRPRKSKPAASDVDLFEQMGRSIRKMVERSLAPLRERIAELEAKQVTLDGVWKDGETYRERCLVTHRGGLWESKKPDNRDRPGTSAAWQLRVKAGDVK